MCRGATSWEAGRGSPGVHGGGEAWTVTGSGFPVRFARPLLPGRILHRYKRFLADVRLEDNSIVTAHCANSGSMQTCYEPEGRVWLSLESNPKRKLQYTWQIAEVGRARIFVHPALANRVAREAIEKDALLELRGYEAVSAEPRVSEHTRFDLLLTRAAALCFVEVKSATLKLGGGRVAFPDAVTERGTKHLRELVRQVGRGHRAVLLFSVNRTDARSLEPARHIDPEYTATLGWAIERGVEVLAYRARISPERVELGTRIPVLLGR
jgi:sugar fermentation stimulation protein A